jgi:hypothetical protein
MRLIGRRQGCEAPVGQHAVAEQRSPRFRHRSGSSEAAVNVLVGVEERHSRQDRRIDLGLRVTTRSLGQARCGLRCNPRLDQGAEQAHQSHDGNDSPPTSNERWTHDGPLPTPESEPDNDLAARRPGLCRLFRHLGVLRKC